MKIVGLACVAILACARPQPVDVVAPDPSTKPLPVPPAPSSPSPIEPSEPLGTSICEPIVRCGVWSGCVWLKRVDDVRYRAIGGSEKSGIFVRRHECASTFGGTSCAVHCKGGDGGPPCVDGLHPEQEECTGAALPRPDSTLCQIGAGICGSFI